MAVLLILAHLLSAYQNMETLEKRHTFLVDHNYEIAIHRFQTCTLL